MLALAWGMVTVMVLLAMVKNGFQVLLGFLFMVSMVATIIFYRAKGFPEKSGNTIDGIDD